QDAGRRGVPQGRGLARRVRRDQEKVEIGRQGGRGAGDLGLNGCGPAGEEGVGARAAVFGVVGPDLEPVGPAGVLEDPQEEMRLLRQARPLLPGERGHDEPRCGDRIGEDGRGRGAGCTPRPWAVLLPVGSVVRQVGRLTGVVGERHDRRRRTVVHVGRAAGARIRGVLVLLRADRALVGRAVVGRALAVVAVLVAVRVLALTVSDAAALLLLADLALAGPRPYLGAGGRRRHSREDERESAAPRGDV